MLKNPSLSKDDFRQRNQSHHQMSWAIPVIIEKRGMAYMKKEVEEDENSTSVVDCVGALFFQTSRPEIQAFFKQQHFG